MNFSLSSMKMKKKKSPPKKKRQMKKKFRQMKYQVMKQFQKNLK